MADTKISALTALAAADIATDDEFAIVDTSVTTTKKTTAADLSARTETLTNKTIDESIISGTPDAEGEFGRDTTQKAFNSFNNGALGVYPRVLAADVGTQALINDAATDQDYTSIYTIPANMLFTKKVLRVTLLIERVTGVSTVTMTPYLKLGSTKVFTGGADNPTNSVTQSMTYQFLIFGRAAAGAAADVSTAGIVPINTNNVTFNTVNQPVALATNGALAITPGLTYSGTGSTESYELQSWLVEELN